MIDILKVHPDRLLMAVSRMTDRELEEYDETLKQEIEELTSSIAEKLQKLEIRRKIVQQELFERAEYDWYEG